MAKQWLIIDEESNKVVGWQRSYSNTIPSNVGKRVLECDSAKMEEYFTLEEEAILQNRFAVVIENDGELYLEDDNRPYFSVSADKLEALADNSDIITFTMTCLDSDDNVIPINESMKFSFNNKLYKLNFVDGVATYDSKFKESGRFTISTTQDYKVKDALTVEAYEA